MRGILSHQLTFSSTFGGVDVVVARRQPRNPPGWLLISFVLLAGLSVDAGFYTVAELRRGAEGMCLARASPSCS